MRIIDARNQEADVLSAPEGEPWRIQLDGGPQLHIDPGTLEKTASGYRTNAAFADLVAQANAEVVVPVVEETAHVSTRAVETGRVQVTRTAEAHDEVVEVNVEHEDVRVERVPVGQVVDERAAPRTEGERTIIPVYREEWVLQRQLVLAEEVHVWKERTQETVSESITLHHDVVAVERS